MKEPQSTLPLKEDLGILLTGAGITANIKLNSMKGIRAALTHNNYIAEMCRKV